MIEVGWDLNMMRASYATLFIVAIIILILKSVVKKAKSITHREREENGFVR